MKKKTRKKEYKKFSDKQREEIIKGVLMAWGYLAPGHPYNFRPHR